MSDKLTPFDFVNAASHTKQDLIAASADPNETVKQYNPFIVNKAFSMWEDTILHANEMNKAHNLFKGAQFSYYLSVLRPRKRFSKWHKVDKSADLDVIQEYYQCNRTVAKGYLKVLTPEALKEINNKMTKGGS